MKTQKQKGTILVGEGVYIYKISTSDNYIYYFRFSGVVFRKSTKTNDRNKASRIALDAYHDAMDKKRSGKIVEKTSFKKLAKKYLESLKGHSAAKIEYHTWSIQAHLMKYFGKFDDVSKITNGTLNDYVIWRK